jgi:hypothetical protein
VDAKRREVPFLEANVQHFKQRKLHEHGPNASRVDKKYKHVTLPFFISIVATTK